MVVGWSGFVGSRKWKCVKDSNPFFPLDTTQHFGTVFVVLFHCVLARRKSVVLSASEGKSDGVHVGSLSGDVIWMYTQEAQFECSPRDDYVGELRFEFGCTRTGCRIPHTPPGLLCMIRSCQGTIKPSVSISWKAEEEPRVL